VELSGKGRFFETTRGKVVSLLRRGGKTVEELAAELELTDNAIRLHLGTLERDGIVRAQGTRHDGTVGKPATVYEIAPDAESAFSRAYAPFLTTLLQALSGRLSPEAMDEVMRDVGHRLASESRKPGRGSLENRVRAAADLLNELGGLTSVEHDADTFTIRGHGCPLSAVTAAQSEVCGAMRVLLSDVTGEDVQEKCDRRDRPSCCFQVTAAD
jgi:predicted ArsR family transcriptional regulator